MPSMTTAVWALLLCPFAAVLAQGCDATFAKKGNAITGLKFSARQTVADLSTPDAINQLRGIVVHKGYDVLATEPEAGDMLLEMPQNANQRSFPLVAKATSDGAAVTVELRANLRAGVMTKEELERGGYGPHGPQCPDPRRSPLEGAGQERQRDPAALQGPGLHARRHRRLGESRRRQLPRGL
jgi:hypothetical protein